MERVGLGREMVWWEGVVEDNDDPLKIGRVRVRVLGWDTTDKSKVPTDQLPWAYPIMPLNNDAIRAILPGTWVIGFFRDATSAQDRLVLGTIDFGEQRAEGADPFA